MLAGELVEIATSPAETALLAWCAAGSGTTGKKGCAAQPPTSGTDGKLANVSQPLRLEFC